ACRGRLLRRPSARPRAREREAPPRALGAGRNQDLGVGAVARGGGRAAGARGRVARPGHRGPRRAHERPRRTAPRRPPLGRAPPRGAARCAAAWAWPGGTAETLRLAAVLHDVGKVGVPDAILLKPGLLEPEERVLMEGHASSGPPILTGAPH